MIPLLGGHRQNEGAVANIHVTLDGAYRLAVQEQLEGLGGFYISRHRPIGLPEFDEAARPLDLDFLAWKSLIWLNPGYRRVNRELGEFRRRSRRSNQRSGSLCRGSGRGTGS